MPEPTTVRGRLCALLNEPNPVSIALAVLVGAVGVLTFLDGLRAGATPGEGAWFVAFLAAYLAGVRELLAE